MISKPGLLLVVSGPSGVGKSTILSELMLRGSREFFFSVSATTRPARPNEIDGKHYHFIGGQDFQKLISERGLLEWAEFAGNYYGTPVDPVNSAFEKGKCVLLDVEVQGALQIKERRPDAVLVFLAPPSLMELERRLRARRTESDDKIKVRLETARLEFLKSEYYDYLVVNDSMNEAILDIEAIIRSQFLRINPRKNFDPSNY